jgi:hypothetical protein
MSLPPNGWVQLHMQETVAAWLQALSACWQSALLCIAFGAASSGSELVMHTMPVAPLHLSIAPLHH